MTSQSLIERVARAIALEHGGFPDTWELHADEARAAIGVAAYADRADLRAIHFIRGVRWAISYLRKRADEMHDPKARAILNAAASDLGQDKTAALKQPER